MHMRRNFIYWHAGYQFRLELPRRPWSETRVITLAARKHSFAEQQELFYLSLSGCFAFASVPSFLFRAASSPYPAVPPICILARPRFVPRCTPAHQTIKPNDGLAFKCTLYICVCAPGNRQCSSVFSFGGHFARGIGILHANELVYDWVNKETQRELDHIRIVTKIV